MIISFICGLIFTQVGISSPKTFASTVVLMIGIVYTMIPIFTVVLFFMYQRIFGKRGKEYIRPTLSGHDEDLNWNP